jgi:hypothetical protein
MKGSTTIELVAAESNLAVEDFFQIMPATASAMSTIAVAANDIALRLPRGVWIEESGAGCAEGTASGDSRASIRRTGAISR